MAGYDIFFTGFEGGKADWPHTKAQAIFVDDSLARTGEYYLRCFDGAAGGDGSITGPTPSAGQGISSSYAKGVCRVFFKLEQLSAFDVPAIMGFCPFDTPADGCQLRVNGNTVFGAHGTFNITAYTLVGPPSTAVLALNTWYRADLTMTLTDNGSDASAVASCSVYTEAGVLIETVSHSATGITAGPDFPPPALGNHATTAALYNVSFDDWYSQIVDAQTPVLPTQTRITRVSATGKTGTWSGIYQNIINIPYGESAVDAVFSSTLDAQLKFSHDTETTLGLSSILGFNLYSMIKASAAGDESILINNTQYTVGVLTTYPSEPYFYQQMGSSSDIDFNAMTFGVQNRRSQTVTVSQQYMEVLHGGSNLPRDLDGEDSWKHKVIQFTATGGFDIVTGVGFRSQVIICKKYSGTDETGFFKLGLMGGTQSRPIDANTVDPLAIQYVTDDGFTIGPSFEAGEVYVALCIQDGGFGFDCKYLRYGAFVGFSGVSAKDDIIIKAAWEPDFLMVEGEDLLVYVTNEETLGNAIPLIETTGAPADYEDYIDLLNSDGFTIGTRIKGSDQVCYYFAIRELFDLDTLFNFGEVFAIGPGTGVTGLNFQPSFAFAARIAAIIPQWRSALVHSGADSSLWNETTINTTGITSFTSNGLNLGSSLSQAGDTTKWVAFKDEGEIIATADPFVDAGPDQTVAAFNTVTLAGSGGAGFYPCAVTTFLWSKVSGPGTVTFVDTTDPTTNVSFSEYGVYILRLAVSNGLSTATDEIQITITCLNPTSLDAGPDQTVLLGTTVQLAAVVGLTGPGVTLLWVKVSGPGSVNFSNTASAISTVTFSSAGIYVLRISATSICKSLTDTITITVLDACVMPSADPTFDCE